MVGVKRKQKINCLIFNLFDSRINKNFAGLKEK